MTIFGDEQTQARTIWLLSILVVGIGIAAVWWPSSQRLGATRAQATEFYEVANQNDAEVKRGGELLAARAGLLADIATLRGQSSGTAATAVALTSISGEAKRLHVDVRSLIPQSENSSEGALVRTDIALAVRGHFRNVVAFIADLPRHASLIGVDGITIDDAASSTVPSMLDATIHVSLYRLHDPAVKENIHAASAP